MALGKPVSRYLHDEAVAPHRGGLRRARAARPDDEGDAARDAAAARRDAAERRRDRRREPRLRRARPRPRAGSPTACSTSTPALSADPTPGRRDAASAPRPVRYRPPCFDQIKRLAQALRDLRPRRARLARSSRSSCCRSTRRYLDHERLRRGRRPDRAHGGARDDPARRHLERVLPLLLRLERDRRSACSCCARPSGSRWRWRRPGSSPASLLAGPIARPARHRRPVARPRCLRRDLGADELRAADRALPRRGALGRVRASRASRTR